MEVVHPRAGDAVALGPCPPWCTESRRFADDDVIDADDGYHHYATEIEVPTAYPFLGLGDEGPTIVRAVLKSWTRPLDADPGPTLVELNLGTAKSRTDASVEATPAEARAIARALLAVADAAERGGKARVSS